MIETVRTDFFDGCIGRNEVEIDRVIGTLDRSRTSLASWPVGKIIELLDRFSAKLLDRKNPIHRRHPHSGIPFIAGWCRKTNIKRLLQASFFDTRVLDRFESGSGTEKHAYRAFPRGLAVHWMAGNVPTLGFLSLIQGILTKNANLIKTASQSGDLLADLLEVLSSVEMDEVYSGRALTRSIAVIRYDRNRGELGKTISRHADIRIFWGNDESVRTLKSLPAKLDAVDLVFSNKTSFMAIDRTSLNGTGLEKAARLMATDISVFEQKACASPHTLFLETREDKDIERVADLLQSALDDALSTIPKEIPLQKEISAILNLRTQYDMFHRAWYSEGIEFTILSDSECKLGPPIGNRTLFIRKIDDLRQLGDLITPNVQSVGLLADKKRHRELSCLLAEKGVQRITRIGAMTQFQMPWDGYFIPHYLVRWAMRMDN